MGGSQNIDSVAPVDGSVIDVWGNPHYWPAPVRKFQKCHICVWRGTDLMLRLTLVEVHLDY